MAKESRTSKSEPAGRTSWPSIWSSDFGIPSTFVIWLSQLSGAAGEEFARRGDMRDAQKVGQLWQFGMLRGIEHRADLIRFAQKEGEKTVHFRNTIQQVAIAKQTEAVSEILVQR